MAREINLYLVLTTALVIVIANQGGDCVDESVSIDFGNYTIHSATGLVLAASNTGDDNILTTSNSDLATMQQIWEVRRADSGECYLLVPTMDKLKESKRTIGIQFLGHFPYVKLQQYDPSTSRYIYWSIVRSDEKNLYMIQNNESKLCLEAAGSDKVVRSFECSGKSPQLWKFLPYDEEKE